MLLYFAILWRTLGYLWVARITFSERTLYCHIPLVDKEQPLPLRTYIIRPFLSHFLHASARQGRAFTYSAVCMYVPRIVGNCSGVTFHFSTHTHTQHRIVSLSNKYARSKRELFGTSDITGSAPWRDAGEGVGEGRETNARRVCDKQCQVWRHRLLKYFYERAFWMFAIWVNDDANAHTLTQQPYKYCI